MFKIRDSVPSVSYSSVCNVLRQWNISLIPTYRVYGLYDILLGLYILTVHDNSSASSLHCNNTSLFFTYLGVLQCTDDVCCSHAAKEPYTVTTTLPYVLFKLTSQLVSLQPYLVSIYFETSTFHYLHLECLYIYTCFHFCLFVCFNIMK